MIPLPGNFSLSNLVAFAGLAAVILANQEKPGFFSGSTYALWVGFLYIFGTLGVLVYGLQDTFSNIISPGVADYLGQTGYLSILFGTVLLILILIVKYIQSIQGMILIQIGIRTLTRKTRCFLNRIFRPGNYPPPACP
jgi:hypothetical protein